MLSPELLALLCCPKCKGGLEYNPDRQTLTCKKCNAVYPIKDGIPIMLVPNENGTAPSSR